MSASDNRRRNFQGNVEDDEGGSYYVLDSEDRKIAGPFGTASYTMTVLGRLEGDGYREPLKPTYKPGE